MRVIAGDFKGRKLETPYDDKVRPTTDKVKEAMFSILMNDTYDRVFCDVFAGTGGLGLEALSRGAKKCYFIDQSNDSLKLVRENVIKCQANDFSIIIQGDFRRALTRIKEKVDVFIIDPPYSNGIELEVLETIKDLNLLEEEGKIIVEHSAKDQLPDEISGFTKIKEKKYGKIAISVFV